MKDALKHARRAAVGTLPAAILAGLGMPALAALVFLAVLVLGMVCWVIGNGDRSDRVTRMIFARRGDITCLESRPLHRGSPSAAATPPAACTVPINRWARQGRRRVTSSGASSGLH